MARSALTKVDFYCVFGIKGWALVHNKAPAKQRTNIAGNIAIGGLGIS